MQISRVLFSSLFSGHCVLWTLAVLVSMQFYLCLLKSRDLSDSAWVSLPEPWPAQSLQAVSWGIQIVHFFRFLSLGDYCPSFSDVHCF